MLIVPRSYQVEAVDSIFTYFGSKQGNPLIAMPTGTGKSIVIAMFLERAFRFYPNQKVLVVTHVKELIQQNFEKFIALWPGAPAGINSAGLGQRDIYQKIIFAGIGSIAKQAASFGKVDLVLIDEAHLVNPSEATMYQKFLAQLLAVNPFLKIIGFTATPWRLGVGHITKGEDNLFTDVCFDITTMGAFNRLIGEGFLAPLIPKPMKTLLNVDGVHSKMGEFKLDELQAAVNIDRITEAALREAIELGHDRKHWLIFAAGVEHADSICNILNHLGVSCVSVHSKLAGGDKERDDNIELFKRGHVRAVVNNNVLTTGFDMPGIDMILVLRPTMSSVLWVQMLGRGTRPAPGKINCLVLDFARNTPRLGPINDPLIPKRKGEKGHGEAPVKVCTSCSTYNHASVRHCFYCGAEFIQAIKFGSQAGTDELIKGELPIVELFKIDHIIYSKHQKQDKPLAMKVSYYCGYSKFDEWICFEHGGFAGRKARLWWEERAGPEVQAPETTLRALSLTDRLRTPTHMRVWVNKQFPDIMGYCYDGTAFGTQEASDSDPGPTHENNLSSVLNKTLQTSQVHDFVGEDDIPF